MTMGTAGLSAGDTIAYGFTVTNTGTQTLTEITLSDPNVTVSGGPDRVSCAWGYGQQHLHGASTR